MLLHVHATKIENVTTMFNDHQSYPDPSIEYNNLNPYLDNKDAPKYHWYLGGNTYHVSRSSGIYHWILGLHDLLTSFLDGGNRALCSL